MHQLDDLIAQVKRLSQELDKRVAKHATLEPYLEGNCPFPPAVSQARLTKLYRHLMPVAEAPWGSLVVDSKLDRLEVSGIRDVDQAAADRVWAEAWQTNGMDSEAKLGHGAALLDGRCYATVWPHSNGEPVATFDGAAPDIALDDMTQMVVEFAEGSRRKRTAALRRWNEGRTTYATLYRPDGVYKFKGPDDSASTVTDTWEKRSVKDESWPLANPFNAVPVVEIAVNRRLKPGAFPYTRGEFAHCIGLIDRINLLTFLGLVVAIDLGFPIRGVTGDKIRRRVLKDDDGNTLIDDVTGKEKTEAVAPFQNIPGSVAQFENPEARTFEFKAADRGNMSVFAELDQLAVITKTPRHYFPLEQGMSNLSAEAIMASEGAMHAGVTGHKSTLGEGWEEVNRLSGQVLGVELSQRAETVWMDHQSRSLAERADAASKLKDVVPGLAVAEIALNATQEQIARWQQMSAADPLAQLVTAANGVPAG